MKNALFRPLKTPFNVTWPNKSPCHMMPKTYRQKLKKTKLGDRRHKETSHSRCIESIRKRQHSPFKEPRMILSLIQEHPFYRRYLKRQFVNPPGSSESSTKINSILNYVLYFSCIYNPLRIIVSNKCLGAHILSRSSYGRRYLN